MDPIASQRLIELNRRFYQDLGAAFAATRRRLQPGAQRVLASLPMTGHWLDLGCGSGEVARQLARLGATGSYLGLDFSAELLAEARRGWEATGEGFTPRFELADLSAPDWAEKLLPEHFDVILCLAALHHLPGEDARLGLLRQARSVMEGGGVFIHSEWQFQHSAKLMARRLAWETIGLGEGDVEVGDTLLDWRYALPGQAGQTGVRYVHLFTGEELGRLAELSGFCVEETFEIGWAGRAVGALPALAGGVRRRAHTWVRPYGSMGGGRAGEMRPRVMARATN